MKVWWKICICVEKCNSFCYKFWSPIKKMCRTFGGIVQQGRESCIILVRRIFLKTKQIFLGNMVFFTFLWLRAEKNLTSDFFSTLLTKNCVLPLQSTNLKIFFEHFSIFSTNYEIWEWISYTLSAKCSAQLSKVYFTCTDDFLIKNWISAEKCNCFFITLVLLAKIAPDFCRKSSGTAIKTAL